MLPNVSNSCKICKKYSSSCSWHLAQAEEIRVSFASDVGTSSIPHLAIQTYLLGSCLYFGQTSKLFPYLGTLLTIYLPGTLRIESSPKTTPSPRVTNTFWVKDIISLLNQFIIEHRWYSQTDLTQIRRDHIKLASLNNVHLLADVALPADKIPRGEHLRAGTVLLLTPWNTEYER